MNVAPSPANPFGNNAARLISGASPRCCHLLLHVKAVYETAESDNPTKSTFEKQFVGHRLDVLITDRPRAKVIGDVFTVTKQVSDYIVSQRGSMRNDWVLLRTDHGSSGGTITETVTVMHIRTWNEPVRFTFAWGSILAVGTCEQVK
jgi:hypothetical protein